MRGVNPVLTLALSLFGLVASTVGLSVATVRGITGGIIFSLLGLAGACGGMAYMAYLLLAR